MDRICRLSLRCKRRKKASNLPLFWFVCLSHEVAYYMSVLYLIFPFTLCMFQIFQRFFFRNIGAIIMCAFVGTTVSCMVFGYVTQCVTVSITYSINCTMCGQMSSCRHLHNRNTSLSFLASCVTFALLLIFMYQQLMLVYFIPWKDSTVGSVGLWISCQLWHKSILICCWGFQFL